jgi:ABC-type phosphate transport system substrate-binding protein
MSLLTLIFWMQIARADSVRLVVIVSPSQSVTNISSTDLRAIYLGQTTRWPTRRRILPVIITPRSIEGQTFVRRVIHMAEVDYAQYWIGIVFRGQAASAPLVASSTEEASRFVAAHAEAIGVVGNIPAEKNVRILTVDGKSVEATDYPLRW